MDVGWIQAANGYAYTVLNTESSWFGAIAKCVEKKGHLVYVGMRDRNERRYGQ